VLKNFALKNFVLKIIPHPKIKGFKKNVFYFLEANKNSMRRLHYFSRHAISMLASQGNFTKANSEWKFLDMHIPELISVNIWGINYTGIFFTRIFCTTFFAFFTPILFTPIVSTPIFFTPNCEF